MRCFECMTDARTEEAVGVCTSCGAGVCATCVRLETRDRPEIPSPGNPEHRVTRALTCRTCDAVLGAQPYRGI